MWQEAKGLAPGDKNKRGREARGLTRFIRALARTRSGEATMTNARSLLKTLRRHISGKTERRIRKLLPVLRRDANRSNPPAQRAAEAVSLETLRGLLREARAAHLTRREGQALDIFLAAFESMSRVAEIASLEVDDVSPDGRTIMVRPKTRAQTWLKLTKRLSGRGGFNAAERLVLHRERARREGRTYLFVGRHDKPPETAAITAHLRRLCERLGCEARITSHSARKGAAVEALRAGVPLPVIQALGAWKDGDSMQAYIGEAVRRSTSLLDILGEVTGRHHRGWPGEGGRRKEERQGRDKGRR